MKYYDWNDQKNLQLKLERGIGFEEIVSAINEGGLLEVLRHPNKAKYPDQKIYIVKIGNYAFAAPFVEDDEKYFLKTIYPSRKFTKKHLIEGRKQ